MICLYWNIRGVANNASRNALKKLILQNNPDFVFIAEPWMNFDLFPKTWLSRLDLKMFALNNRSDLLPNIWCLCKSNLDPVVIDYDDQQVSFSIISNGNMFGYSVIYASTSYLIRRNLWLRLSNINPNIPWSIIRDFNAIISAGEYKGSHTPARVPIADFCNWSNSNNFIHLPTLGSPFTWCNGRRGRQRTEKRLDRVICNLALINFCSSATCHTLPKVRSDHYPLLYNLNLESGTFKSQFKFLKIWANNDDCHKLIEDVWRTKVYGCPMYVLDRKLKLLKLKLKDWNKSNFGNVQTIVSNAQKELNSVQSDIALNGHSDILQDKETKAQHDLEVALNMEEEFWREKSRIKWQVHGDRNTNYFHTYAKIRRRTSMINSLVINNDVVTDNSIMEKHIVDHFKELFNRNFVMQDSDLIKNVIPTIVNQQSNDLLTMIPNADEVHHAVMSLNADSAPGPDGFGGIFFHKFGNIIKLDVIDAVIQFFTQGWILPNYNANTIVLIPKVKEASSLGQYRPIALANFKFKII